MNVADEIEKLIKLRDRGVLTLEEFQELKTYTLGMESIDPARANNTDQPPLATKTSNPQNTYVKAAVGLISVIACIALGIWIAQKSNDNTAKTDTEAKSEAEQKQAASDEAFEKMLAENKKGAEKIMANSRNSETAQNPETSPTPAPEPVQEQPEAQQTPQETATEPEPTKEATSPPKEETTETKPAAELISYSSPATPYVNQMIEAAKDTEKLFAAKASIDVLPRPAKGDRKAARQLNDSAIKLMGEKKYAEAIPVLQQAHSTDPTDIEITNNLAYAQIETGIAANDFTKAKQGLVDTLYLKSARAQAWANLGRVFALEGNENAATHCYINFFRFAENKEKALSRLQEGINETNPALSKALTNAYNYVKTSLQPEIAREDGENSQ